VSKANEGKYYWGIRITRSKKPRTLYVFADEIKVQDGDLLLYGHLADGTSYLYRSLARGTWQDVFAASCLSGEEMNEDHDFDESTHVDARGAAA
jgi:hypothetical protein